MRKAKRILAVLLSGVLCVGILTGCNSGNITVDEDTIDEIITGGAMNSSEKDLASETEDKLAQLLGTAHSLVVDTDRQLAISLVSDIINIEEASKPADTAKTKSTNSVQAEQAEILAQIASGWANASGTMTFNSNSFTLFKVIEKKADLEAFDGDSFQEFTDEYFVSLVKAITDSVTKAAAGAGTTEGANLSSTEDSEDQTSVTIKITYKSLKLNVVYLDDIDSWLLCAEVGTEITVTGPAAAQP